MKFEFKVFKINMEMNKTMKQHYKSKQQSREVTHTNVRLSNKGPTLQQICQHQNLLVQKVSDLNHQAILLIRSDRYQNALELLNQAESVLEFVAGYGKQIDIALIMSVLKNTASAHQKSWNLTLASDYLQGILVNVNRFLFSQRIITETCSDPLHYINRCQFESERQIRYGQTNQSIEKQELYMIRSAGLHYLQYSTLCSQTQRHPEAKDCLLISLSYFHKLCNRLINYEKKQQKKISQILIHLHSYTEVKDKRVKSKINNNVLKKTTEKLRFLMDDGDDGQGNSSTVKKLSISEILQVKPTEFFEEILQKDVPFKTYVSKEKLTDLVMYVSCCYFALATETRLINTSITHQQNRKETEQYKQSKNYHLTAIYICASLSQTNSPYLTHIIQSYKTNYDLDLLDLASNNSYELFIESINRKQKIIDLSSIEVLSSLIVDGEIHDDGSCIKDMISCIKKSNGNMGQSSGKASKCTKVATEPDLFCRITHKKTKNQNLQCKNSRTKDIQTNHKQRSNNKPMKKIKSQKNIHWLKPRNTFNPECFRDQYPKTQRKTVIQKVPKTTKKSRFHQQYLSNGQTHNNYTRHPLKSKSNNHSTPISKRNSRSKGTNISITKTKKVNKYQ